jgi:hypothetical protein
MHSILEGYILISFNSNKKCNRLYQHLVKWCKSTIEGISSPGLLNVLYNIYCYHINAMQYNKKNNNNEINEANDCYYINNDLISLHLDRYEILKEVNRGTYSFFLSFHFLFLFCLVLIYNRSYHHISSLVL